MKVIEVHIDHNEKIAFEEVLQVTETSIQCGLTYTKLILHPEFGNGSLQSYTFDGLTVQLLRMNLSQDLKIKAVQEINNFIISAVIKGEKKLKVPKAKIDIIQENQEGFMAFVNNASGEIHYPKDKMIIELSIKLSPTFIEKHQLNTLFPIEEKYDLLQQKEHFISIIDSKSLQIINEIISDQKQGLLKRLFLESKTLELLSVQIGKEPQKAIKHNSTTKKVLLAKKLISENLHIQYSIAELSKEVFLNEFQLKKEFKRIFEITIFEFALQTRMNKARYSLKHTNKPIYEIAELVGYKNPTHFSAAFKKIENLTPNQYRKLKES
jgi:AraC-like DNA-binding protein